MNTPFAPVLGFRSMRYVCTILVGLSLAVGAAPPQNGDADTRLQQAGHRWAIALSEKIGSFWRRPEGVKDDLRCTLEIRILDDGMIQSVRIVKSSGNTVFDDSAELATRRASPLPLPKDRRVFVKVLRPTFSPSSLERGS